uniref:Uncharacterized protein n=1 Tax=Caenorhabditis japonica TaxID=281687 RepID=A0A8R1DPW3_CAEJA
MESKFSFEMEHEVTNRNEQEDEHRSSIIDDKTLDVEMVCNSLEREHEARTREDEARLKVLEQDLRTYGKIAPNVAKRMIEPIRERFSQREKLIVEKGNKIFQLQLENRVLRIKAKELQRNTFLDKNVERIERIRGHYQETEQSFGEVKNSGNLQERGRHREKILPAQTELSLLSQLYLEQNFPEPPKYTAEEDSVSMGAFERTFAMKFGRLSTEQQVTLLETKYLSGKALKAFRGLVETEKDSVRSILRALANRLRISEEDETRRAKTRWELLRISENQSVEDFCLLLDEVTRVAYRRLPPEELSSLKTAKLLEAIAGSEALRCMIDAKLLESPEKEHYDISRFRNCHADQDSKIDFYVAAVDRETIILGTEGFKAMGIQLKIDEPPRDVRIVDEVKLDRHGQKMVEIVVEGIIHKERRLCLITPTSKCLTAGVCQVNSEGKARIKIANHMSESIFLRKGQKIATGELNGFEVLNKRPELLGKLNKWLRDIEDTKPHKPTVCEVRREVQVGGTRPKGPLKKDGEDAVGNVHSDADSRFGLAHGRKAAKKNVSKEHAMRTRSFDERNNEAKHEHHVRPANRTFTRPCSCLVRNTFGEKYTKQPVDTLLVMAPGVSENVTLAFTEKLILKGAQSAEEMLLKQFNKNRYSRMIMIIPFATDNGYMDQWSRLINVVPGSTKILLIPAPTSINDFSLAGAFISLVASVKRSRGELDVISPGDRVMAHKNQRLVDLGDQMNSFDYWHVVNNVIRGRNLVWQPLKVIVVDRGQTRRRSEPRQRRQYPHREK